MQLGRRTVLRFSINLTLFRAEWRLATSCFLGRSKSVRLVEANKGVKLVPKRSRGFWANLNDV